MLKHERIIKRLSMAEKIGILTDITALEDDNISKLGVPKLDVLYMRHMMRERFPMPSALAHSWDRELIRDVAGLVANDVHDGKSAIVVTPGAKIKLSPYRNEISEDPYLASALSREFVTGAKSTGVAAAMAGYYLAETDADMMDKKPSERVINEFVVEPYSSAVSASQADAILTDMRTLPGAYSGVNAGIRATLMKDQRFAPGTLAICERVEADDTVSFIAGGGICLNGSAVALETALNKYQKLRQSCDLGDLTIGDVEAEVADGKAISPEMIDEAVDRIIDLAFCSAKTAEYEVEDIDYDYYIAPDEESRLARLARIRREKQAERKAIRDAKRAERIRARKIKRGEYIEDEEPEVEEEEIIPEIITAEDKLLRRAATESIVLLRNVNKIAPIKTSSTVAIIGGLADKYNDGSGSLAERCEMLLREAGVESVVKSKGYDFDAERTDSERIITDALTAAGRAGVVLLFLGHGDERGKDIPKTHKISLPANQLILAEKMARFGARVIAVMESGYGIDVGFTEYFAGAIMAPLGCPYDAEALVDVILGRVNPSGRLAYTLYSSFDTYAPKHAIYREKWNVKSGPFIGYRYYDTANLKVGYHFGHGLSYSEVAYSDLVVSKDSVTFTLTNNGKMRVKENAQVYIGAATSNVIRPRKELCGFEIVDLMPKESKQVTIDISNPMVYDVKSGRMREESCTYNIFVGPSSHSELLNGQRYGGSYTLNSDKQNIVDYIQTKSNITIDKYTLEAKYRIMKRSAKNIISGIVSILLAISLGVYNSLESSGAFVSVMTGILAVAGIWFFITEARERNKDYKQARVIIDDANNERFADAEELPEFSAKRMFYDEFDAIDNDIVAKETFSREEGAADESLKYIDKDLDFAKASKELRAFASDRGIELGENEAEKIFASFAASRLVIFKELKSDMFRSLVAVLSEYFETNPYIDTVDGNYVSEESALFGNAAENRAKKNLAYAIEAAQNVKYNIHIAALDGVKCENMLDYFTPYAKYAKNPFGITAITAHNEWDKECVYYLPQNMWFCVNLAEGEEYESIPDYIAEIASVNVISPAKCKVSNSRIVISKFRYYQFDYLSERAGNSFGIFEETWKKIDKLMAYVANYSDFSMENKLCLALEKYATALMAAGIEIPVAVDAALAAKLLPGVAVAVMDKIPEDDRSLDEVLDNLFGEDIIDECREVLDKVADAKAKNNAKKAAGGVEVNAEQQSPEEQEAELVVNEEIANTEEIVEYENEDVDVIEDTASYESAGEDDSNGDYQE